MMLNADEWKETKIFVEDCDGNRCGLDVYLHPDVPKYAIRKVWDYEIARFRWRVLNLETMQYPVINITRFEIAIQNIYDFMNAKGKYAPVTAEALTDELEVRMLAEKPLPDRWSVCVAQLNKALSLPFQSEPYGRLL